MKNYLYLVCGAILSFCDEVYGASPVDACLSNGHSVTAWYTASDYSEGSSIWPDSSGNGYDATIEGTLSLFDGTDTSSALYQNGEPAVYGGTSTRIAFAADTLAVQPQHTVFNLCKYNGATRARVVTARSSNSNTLFGHWGGKSGVAYGNSGWITDLIDRYGSEWVLSSQTAGSYRGNGVDYTKSGWNQDLTNYVGDLWINCIWTSGGGEWSDFACAEVMVFNEQVLDEDERICIEDYFAYKYGLWDTDPCSHLDCDDGDLCTDDSCDPSTGCVNTPKDCGDTDTCTEDSCDSATGECTNTPMDCGDLEVCVAGECQRDCESFGIDDFLVDCSAEFEGQETDISDLQSAASEASARLDGLDQAIIEVNTNLESEIGAVTANLATEVAAREDAIDSVNANIDSEVAAITSSLASIDSQIAEINAQIANYPAAQLAKSRGFGQIVPDTQDENEKDTKWLSPDSKDTLIIALLLLNTLILVAGVIVCAKYGNLGSRRGEYAKVRNAYTSDDEQQRLQN